MEKWRKDLGARFWSGHNAEPDTGHLQVGYWTEPGIQTSYGQTLRSGGQLLVRLWVWVNYHRCLFVHEAAGRLGSHWAD